MNDAELERRLSEWQQPETDEATFRRDVWSKIEQDHASFDWLRSIANFFDLVNRPAVGIPAALTILAIAGFLAIANGRASHDEVMIQMSTNYHGAINPLNHHLD